MVGKKKFTDEEQREKSLCRNREHYHANKEYYLNWCRENIASKLYSVAKQRAKKRQQEFSIDKSDIILPTHCPVLGIELKYNQGTGAGGKDNSYSLDRIDQDKGYIKGNIQVISHKANSMKFTATKEELVKFADWVYKEYTQ